MVLQCHASGKTLFFAWLSWGCMTCASLVVQGSSSVLEVKRSKVKFNVVLDTTCSDCQHWVSDQFNPLWNDDDFQQVILENFDLKFLAHSVTMHKQGPLLNQVLNCAQHQLGIEVFLESLFCWEGNVDAWVPIPGSDRFQEHQLNVTNLMVQCFPGDALQSLATCAAEDNSTINAFPLPAGFNEVPWLVVGATTYSMAGDDSGVYHLKNLLCQKVPDNEKPASCSQSHSLMTEHVHLHS
eukprot:TRINITY_DN65444_c0_g1_i1.p1 TRINITY_DN65444_c0_g1~~TRINITY_DN65444_c0_g1_i1.p1  ORF type:complete len:239 (-),score=39.68 TRINITY_DN65444_c0_g1_i1:32-748(-)